MLDFLNCLSFSHRFPRKIDLNKHRAHCYLPCAVAAILKEDPKLLPHAVKAFYLRDPIDLKVSSD